MEIKEKSEDGKSKNTFLKIFKRIVIFVIIILAISIIGILIYKMTLSQFGLKKTGVLEYSFVKINSSVSFEAEQGKDAEGLLLWTKGTSGSLATDEENSRTYEQLYFPFVELATEKDEKTRIASVNSKTLITNYTKENTGSKDTTEQYYQTEYFTIDITTLDKNGTKTETINLKKWLDWHNYFLESVDENIYVSSEGKKDALIKFTVYKGDFWKESGIISSKNDTEHFYFSLKTHKVKSSRKPSDAYSLEMYNAIPADFLEDNPYPFTTKIYSYHPPFYPFTAWFDLEQKEELENYNSQIFTMFPNLSDTIAKAAPDDMVMVSLYEGTVATQEELGELLVSSEDSEIIKKNNISAKTVEWKPAPFELVTSQDKKKYLLTSTPTNQDSNVEEVFMQIIPGKFLIGTSAKITTTIITESLLTQSSQYIDVENFLLQIYDINPPYNLIGEIDLEEIMENSLSIRKYLMRSIDDNKVPLVFQDEDGLYWLLFGVTSENTFSEITLLPQYGTLVDSKSIIAYPIIIEDGVLKTPYSPYEKPTSTSIFTNEVKENKEIMLTGRNFPSTYKIKMISNMYLYKKDEASGLFESVSPYSIQEEVPDSSSMFDCNEFSVFEGEETILKQMNYVNFPQELKEPYQTILQNPSTKVRYVEASDFYSE